MDLALPAFPPPPHTHLGSPKYLCVSSTWDGFAGAGQRVTSDKKPSLIPPPQHKTDLHTPFSFLSSGPYLSWCYHVLLYLAPRRYVHALGRGLCHNRHCSPGPQPISRAR